MKIHALLMTAALGCAQFSSALAETPEHQLNIRVYISKDLPEVKGIEIPTKTASSIKRYTAAECIDMAEIYEDIVQELQTMIDGDSGWHVSYDIMCYTENMEKDVYRWP